MKYDTERISKLSQELCTYEFFEQHRTGVMEDPHMSGIVLFTIEECSEVDAWILSETNNIGRHGLMHKRNSWESPNVRYRKKQSKSNTDDTKVQEETSSN